MRAAYRRNKGDWTSDSCNVWSRSLDRLGANTCSRPSSRTWGSHDVPNHPPSLLREDFFGEGTLIGYRTPEIMELLRALTLELDQAVQDSLYERINEILRHDVPVTFLFPYFEAYAAHRKIRGLRTPDRPEPIGAIKELRIEDVPP